RSRNATVRSVGLKRSTRSRIATALLAIHFTRRRLASLSCAAGDTTRRANTSVRRWRWPATRWSGSYSNSAFARANEAIRQNQQLVCREKSQAEKRNSDFIRG